MGPHRMAARPGAEHGQTVVELALLLPIIVVLMFGALEVGRVFNTWIMVTQAAREGARAGAARCSSDPACSTTVATWVDDSLAGLDPADRRWSMSPAPYTAGGTLQVQVEYDVRLVTPLVSDLLGGLLTVQSQTSMRIE